MNRIKAYYRGLEEIEDYYLAADVLERVRKGEENVHSAADVRKELGLESDHLRPENHN